MIRSNNHILCNIIKDAFKSRLSIVSSSQSQSQSHSQSICYYSTKVMNDRQLQQQLNDGGKKKKKDNKVLMQQHIKSLERTEQLKKNVKLYKENKLKAELRNQLDQRIHGINVKGDLPLGTKKGNTSSPRTKCCPNCISIKQAVANEHLECFDVLVGSNEMNQSRGDTILHAAIENRSLGLVQKILNDESLVKTGILNTPNQHGFAPIHFVAMSMEKELEDIGDAIESVEKKLRLVENVEGDTPLIAAIKDQQMEQVMFLIEVGHADPSRVSQRTNETPLTIATARDAALMVEYLHKMGARDKVGANLTSLHVAAAVQNLAMCRILLGLDPELVNRVDSDGTTAVFLAAQAGNYAHINFFIERGATIDHTIRSMDGDSVSLVCAQTLSNKTEFAAVIEKSKCRVDKEMNKLLEKSIHLAAKAGNTRLLEYLVVDKKCDINDRNRMGETPLMLAVSSRKPSTVRELIRLGANLNQVDGTGKTALHVAAEIGLPVILSILLKAGANPKLKTISSTYSKTPLQLAIDNDNQNVIHILNKL
ncbi:hypothetical protein DFA_09329 [Cavenderia fasciculata]|uniref:Ankyrin repeat-containing protein n=1 Tax=Cavenderia fasciculata TaxID=261658 RepID=F4Q7B7_CACFS|nr:uncharacterized protein DFA_09329 [Cavenderia fasciculata]EGG16299.1 hypothetical protein DFA_09329 [Cavenderia fasciculata]|eukprot:XP_004354683.1 hypothetical protein DFA_09329 [Cavenderia fasciculata]